MDERKKTHNRHITESCMHKRRSIQAEKHANYAENCLKTIKGIVLL